MLVWHLEWSLFTPFASAAVHFVACKRLGACTRQDYARHRLPSGGGQGHGQQQAGCWCSAVAAAMSWVLTLSAPSSLPCLAYSHIATSHHGFVQALCRPCPGGGAVGQSYSSSDVANVSDPVLTRHWIPSLYRHGQAECGRFAMVQLRLLQIVSDVTRTVPMLCVHQHWLSCVVNSLQPIVLAFSSVFQVLLQSADSALRWGVLNFSM